MLGYQCIHQVFLPHKIQDCIPVGCIPHTRWPYLPACTAQGGTWSGGTALGGAWSGGCLLRGAWSGGVPCLSGGVPGPWGRGGCLVPGGCGIQACTEADPPREWNSWHTLLKILPCPKLLLRAVKINSQIIWPLSLSLKKNAIQTLTTVPAKLDVDCTKCHRYQKQLHSYLVLGTKVIINPFKRGRNRFAPMLHTMTLD